MFMQDLRSPSQASQALSRTTSFSSNVSDTDDRPRRRSEPAYSFVGMHCIFDQCKAMGNCFFKWESVNLSLHLA